MASSLQPDGELRKQPGTIATQIDSLGLLVPLRFPHMQSAMLSQMIEILIARQQH
jgi:hypothetical protein